MDDKRNGYPKSERIAFVVKGKPPVPEGTESLTKKPNNQNQVFIT
jgi:hypothetical protein